MSCVVFRVRFAESRPFGTHPQIPSMANPDSSNLLSKPILSTSQGSELLQGRDACGVGCIANLEGERTHDIVSKATAALGCMEHRGVAGPACTGESVSCEEGRVPAREESGRD